MFDLASLETSNGHSSDLELLVSWVPSAPTRGEGFLAAYSVDETSVAPRLMTGPRRYVPTEGTGTLAAGDIDADGYNEVLIADAIEAGNSEAITALAAEAVGIARKARG